MCKNTTQLFSTRDRAGAYHAPIERRTPRAVMAPDKRIRKINRTMEPTSNLQVLVFGKYQGSKRLNTTDLSYTLAIKGGGGWTEEDAARTPVVKEQGRR